MLLAEKLGEPLSGVRSSGDKAIVAGKPDLADGFAFGHAVIPGAQIAKAPRPHRRYQGSMRKGAIFNAEDCREAAIEP